MKIIYLSGFGGNESSETYRSLLLKYPETSFIKYNNENAEIAFEQIKNILQNKSNKTHIIIGQSLGGFWAEYFAKKYNYSVILINPSLKPHENLAKYNLTETELENFRKYKVEEKIETKLSIIVSKNDTIVNPDIVVSKYKNIVEIKYLESDHQINEFETLYTEIEYRIKKDKLIKKNRTVNSGLAQSGFRSLF